MQTHQNLHQNISKAKEKQLLMILDRLLTGEPIQYILGNTEFFGLVFNIDKRALIPRPETEFLVKMVVEDYVTGYPESILDIGTGSGCIAISLAKSFSNSNITAIDKSEDAIELARYNAQQNDVSIDLVKDDILNPQATYSLYHIIISNPPYVRNSEKQFMHRNILDFEPEDALFVSDDDPLIYYRAIADFGKKYLHQEGKIYLELNEFLSQEIMKFYSLSCYKDITIHKDLNQKDRYLTAKK